MLSNENETLNKELRNILEDKKTAVKLIHFRNYSVEESLEKYLHQFELINTTRMFQLSVRHHPICDLHKE